MRANGEGSIQKLPNGKYRANRRLNGSRVYGPSVERKQDALPALRAKLKALEEKPAETPTLLTCVQRRIERISSGSSQHSPTTVDLWRAFEKRLNHEIGQKPVDQISAEDLTSWLSVQTGEPRTRRNYLQLMHQLLKEHGNPTKITLPRAPTGATNPRVLTPKEEVEILALDMREEVRIMVLLGLKMGLRRSEIAGLHHTDRDGDGVMIQRAVVRAKGVIVLKDTKTESSEAWVPICPELASYIGEHSGYVIGGKDRPISPSVLDDRWRRLVKGTKFVDVGLHDLRRTFAMRLLESGVDVRTAAEMLRHDPQMLLKIYSRSRRDLKRAAMLIIQTSKPVGAVLDAKSSLG